MSYEAVYAIVASTSIIGSVVVGILLPGPWPLLCLLFLVPIIGTVLLIRKRLNRE